MVHRHKHKCGSFLCIHVYIRVYCPFIYPLIASLESSGQTLHFPGSFAGRAVSTYSVRSRAEDACVFTFRCSQQRRAHRGRAVTQHEHRARLPRGHRSLLATPGAGRRTTTSPRRPALLFDRVHGGRGTDLLGIARLFVLFLKR